eukprot:TRINITY_DN52472_c0_g1_i2.p1 TRINITY_DN52472_c0_g1~~TRINITY_DN52472_c0_g1_i2.p1  ORF type:complete len:194 (-),score=43.26 TRINITY_DN52472_c0_g1_i2:253-798(-)
MCSWRSRRQRQTAAAASPACSLKCSGLKTLERRLSAGTLLFWVLLCQAALLLQGANAVQTAGTEAELSFSRVRRSAPGSKSISDDGREEAAALAHGASTFSPRALQGSAAGPGAPAAGAAAVAAQLLRPHSAVAAADEEDASGFGVTLSSDDYYASDEYMATPCSRMRMMQARTSCLSRST